LFLSRLAQHEVFAMAHSHAVIASLLDGLLWTDFHTGGAENAATEIKRHGFSFQTGNGLRRTYRHTGVAAFGTFNGINFKCAAVAVRQGGCWAFGIGHCFATALQPMSNGINDKHNF
jgi:hypothetical protein